VKDELPKRDGELSLSVAQNGSWERIGEISEMRDRMVQLFVWQEQARGMLVNCSNDVTPGRTKPR